MRIFDMSCSSRLRYGAGFGEQPCPLDDVVKLKEFPLSQLPFQRFEVS